MAENEKALNQLNDCNLQVVKLEQEKRSLELQNARFQDDMSALTTETKLTLAEQTARYNSLQALFQTQKDVLDMLKVSISEALNNYKLAKMRADNNGSEMMISPDLEQLYKILDQ
ncbi:MAG: hypothetical protein HXX13_04115 [Bacteroidetes bacterium]|nr:hypothetical protein [Bacteroidota bacterium]